MVNYNSENKNDSKQFFSGVTILALSTFIVKLIGMFYKIPMIALIGAEGMGYFNSAYEIYSLLFVISTTGIPVAISILISENRAQGKYRVIKQIYRVSVYLLGIIGLIGTLIMAIFYEKLAFAINNNNSAFCILAISPTLFMICLSSAIRGYFQGNQIMLPTAISQVIEALGKLLLGLGFAFIGVKKGYPIHQVAALAVLGLSIGVALSLLYLWLFKIFRPISIYRTIGKIDVESHSNILKNLLRIAIPVTISSTILSLTKIIDMTMILSRLSDISYSQEDANSIYGAYSTMAVSIYNLPLTLISSIALPLVPLLTSAIEENNNAKEKNTLSIALKLTGLIAFPTGLGVAVFSKPILELLFATQIKEIEYVAPLLSILGLTIFLSAMISVTNAILQSYKSVRTPIISITIGILIKIILAYALIGIPQVNIYGAPISTFFSTAAIVSINMYFIIKQTGAINSILNLFGKTFISAFISVGIGMILFLLISQIYYSRIVTLALIVFVAIIYSFTIIKSEAVTESEILQIPHGEKILRVLKKIHLV